MAKQKQNKKKNEVNPLCKICNKIIFTKVDRYCRLTDYYKGDVEVEFFYHTKCFNDKIKGTPEMNKMKLQAMALLKKAGQLIGKESGEEVYVVE